MSEERPIANSPAAARPPSGRTAAPLVALTALTLWVFAPVLGFDFVQWDDDRLILTQPMISQGLGWETLRWLPSGVVQNNWAPVAWLSHMVDVSLYGLAAGGHHLTSLLFHVADALLLYLGLAWLSGSRGRSFLCAALFAVHPLHVESVAWISERRDVLSVLFALLALGAHARWARRRERWAYAAGLVALALGLASKAMLVSLPVLLLLVDVWPLRRGAEGPARLLLEKLPHALLVAAFIAVTFATQQEVQSAALPIGLRVSNALASCWIYLGQTLWPRDLAVLYPHPILPGGAEPLGPLATAVAGGGLAALTMAALLALPRRPYLAVGWLWYLVTLLPVLGLVQVGQQAHADRYTYLPLIGIFVAAVWGLGDASERVVRGRAALAHARTLAAALAIGACALLAREQVGYWRDSVTLFEHAVRVTEGNFQMHYNLANVLKRRGETEGAIAHYREAVAIHPGMSRAHYNLANTLRAQGELDEAIRHYELAADHGSDARYLQGLVGAVRERDGNYDALVAYFQGRLAARPDSVADAILLGHAYRLNEDYEAAAEAYRAAAALRPDDAALQKAVAEAEAGLPAP